MSNVAEHARETAGEPTVRTVRRELPNLRNTAVAEEYERQRTVIRNASPQRQAETSFWESAQADEGWI